MAGGDYGDGRQRRGPPRVRSFHDRVATDDLPRFEGEFKGQLNTNTIRELARFNNWLHRRPRTSTRASSRINEALGAIDYNPGRYITLVAERTVNQDVQDFRAESAQRHQRQLRAR